MARSSPSPAQTKPPAWHTLTLPQVHDQLATAPRGLSRAEAQARLARHGLNVLEPIPPPGVAEVLVEQFRSPLIYILLVATAVTLILQDFIDASVIAAVLALNAAIGFTQERRAQASVQGLAELVTPRARVVREGRDWDIDSRELVPGDLVLLESGVRVPADLRLETVTALEIDESLLTGESLPLSKHADPISGPDLPLADRQDMAFAGTMVTTGRGRGFVVATGMHTALGDIAARVRSQAVPDSPLQQRMARLARVIGVGVAAASVAVFALGVALGESAREMFTVAVALAVSAVPEGLPVAVTVTLARGVRRMAKRNAIIRHLPAVETLGSTTIIASDKTGTLTENRMAVREVWAGGALYRLEEDLLPSHPAPSPASPLTDHPSLYLALLAGVLSNEAEIYRLGEDFESNGDPTEAALLIGAARLGIEPGEVREAYPTEASVPFESERQYSAQVCRHGDAMEVFVKGAPERILAMSDSLMLDSGPVDLDPEQAEAAAHAMAKRGLRVLAMAYRSLPAGDFDPENPGPLCLLGFQGLLDPPRPGVREAIAGCLQAGIRVIMITGDHAITAAAIAGELGIVGAHDEAPLTGGQISRMEDPALEQQVGRANVYARTTPQHKLRIVDALRRRGDVVAVTGDGVNDAPALRAGDIGIAMGKGGTDVAREVADMVLADDNFVSIHAAVEEGRGTFDNIRKVTFFLISTGVAEILAIVASMILKWPVPMVAAQLLWLNLVTNGLQDVAIAFETTERDVLKQPPRRRNEGIISPILWERILISGLVMAAGTLALYRWELNTTGSLEEARTVAVTTMVLFQVMHVGNSRSERLSAFARSPLSNPFLFIATGTALGVHVAALYLPPAQYILRLEPITVQAWIRIIPVSLGVIAVVEAHKLIRGGPRRWFPQLSGA